MVRDLPGGATVSNEMSKLSHYGHVYYTDLDISKNCVLIFGSFLDIRQNAEWSRLLWLTL